MSDSVVGRGPETASIDAALARTLDGHGGALFLVGAPGMGKSHLARVAGERARATGFRVAIGRCWEAGGAPPGWPFRELVRSLATEPDVERACADLGERRRYLGILVPELALAGAEPVVEPSAGERFEAFDAVTSVLARIAAARPLLIVLEDLHAADQQSVELLSMVTAVAASARLLVIGTYRSREARTNSAVAAGLAAAGRSAEVIALEPLGRAAGAILARQVLGEGAGQAVVDDVLDASDGNPLFVLELARATASRARTGATAPLSGLDHAIAAHLAAVSRDALAVAELAAVFGREVDTAVLARSGGALGDGGWEACLDELERAEIVIRHRAEGRVSFVHILVRDAIYARMAPARRRALHAEAARQLERGGASASEIAHHQLAAVPEVRYELAIDWGRRAGKEAVAGLALADAAAILARTVELADASLVLEARDRLLLHLDLAEARVMSGEVPAGREICKRVGATVEADPDVLARAALIYGMEMTRGTVDTDMVGLLERALEALGREPSRLRAMVLGRYATARFPCEDPEVPVRFAQEAISMARALGDSTTLFRVLSIARLPLFFWYPAREHVALEEERLALARDHASPLELLRELMLCSFTFLGASDIARFDALISEATALAERCHTPLYVFRLQLVHAMAAGRVGRFAEAEEWITRAEECSRKGALSPPIPVFMFCRLGQASLRRDRAYLSARRDELARELIRHPNGFALRAWLFAFLGEHADARAELAKTPADLRGRPLTILALLADAAVAVGDRVLAAGIYDLLRPFGDDTVMWGLIGFTAEGAAHARLGLLATALDRPDDADVHFRRAVELDRASGARASLANTLEDWGRFLMESNDAARRARADAVLAEAIALLDELGLEARAAAVRARGAPGAAASPEAPALLELARDGDVFEVRLGPERVTVRDSKGMRYLELLAARPGREVHVLELVAAEAGEATGDCLDSDAGPLLDGPAKEAYRRRLRELEAALPQAEERGDLGRAAVIRHELEALLAELSRAVGLGGRDRKAGSGAERARVNVQRRLRSAVASIGKNSKIIESHLTRAVRTGTFCSYDPPAVE